MIMHPTTSAAVEILRFNTCGSVDDGKSTLIGRLLHDSKSLMEDQLEALNASADLSGDGRFNLANLTDGLRAEREQGITIDVAYRYFSTPARRFIIADTPGHVQYTRNMVTGASTANLSIILVDARAGVIDQSRRHTAIAGLLRIPHLVVAVNKMDLVDWSRERFEEIRAQFLEFLPRANITDVVFIPISALDGDNVVDASPHTPWYHGPTLLGHLETVHIANDRNLETFRFPVQWVNRPHYPVDPRLHDFRGYSGQIAGGVVRKGERVMVLPGGIYTTVRTIHTFNGEVEEACCPQSVTLLLEDDVDAGRGSMIIGAERLPGGSTELRARLCWMHVRALRPGAKLLLKHTTSTVQAVVTTIESKLDVANLTERPGATELVLNDRIVHTHRFREQRHARRRHARAADNRRLTRAHGLRDLSGNMDEGETRIARMHVNAKSRYAAHGRGIKPLVQSDSGNCRSGASRESASGPPSSALRRTQ
jgi:sulfate adenylyltransferase subunit 1